MKRRSHRGIQPATRPLTYWTRTRVLAGMQLFFKRHGFAPTATEPYHNLVKGSGMTYHRDFPSAYAVLRWFSSFREAWTAAGVEVDRGWEPWTADEDWYLHEATGILSRKQIAFDLRRTQDSVHRRQYDLGLNARTRWGWTVHRVGEALRVPGHRITTYIERGDLPCFRGNHYIYLDPADLIGLPVVDLRRASKEFKAAARHSLLERLAKIVGGFDWRAGRVYQPHPIHQRRYNDRLILANPKPNRIRQGDTVEVVKRHRSRRVRIKRRGVVKMVHFSTRVSQWRARVEFKKQLRHGEDEPRVIYSIPLTKLKKVRKSYGNRDRY